MAAGGGPSPEQWAKMTRNEKTAYWVWAAITFAIIGGLCIKKIFF